MSILTLEAHGVTMRMHESPGKIAKCWKAAKPYEAPLCEHIYEQGLEGLALDVGANIGNHTLWFAMVCGLDVVAFEPLKVPELRANLALNGLDVRVEACALGREVVGASHVGKGRLESGKGKIRVRRLDDHNLEGGISLIKADVEGMEADVFAGGVETIDRDRPVIFAEAWPGDWHDKTAAVLEPLGYRMTERFHSKGVATAVERWDG